MGRLDRRPQPLPLRARRLGARPQGLGHFHGHFPRRRPTRYPAARGPRRSRGSRARLLSRPPAAPPTPRPRPQMPTAAQPSAARLTLRQCELRRRRPSALSRLTVKCEMVAPSLASRVATPSGCTALTATASPHTDTQTRLTVTDSRLTLDCGDSRALLTRRRHPTLSHPRATGPLPPQSEATRHPLDQGGVGGVCARALVESRGGLAPPDRTRRHRPASSLHPQTQCTRHYMGGATKHGGVLDRRMRWRGEECTEARLTLRMRRARHSGAAVSAFAAPLLRQCTRSAYAPRATSAGA